MILLWRAYIAERERYILIVSSAFGHLLGFKNRRPSGGLYDYDASEKMRICYELHYYILDSSAVNHCRHVIHTLFIVHPREGFSKVGVG